MSAFANRGYGEETEVLRAATTNSMPVSWGSLVCELSHLWNNSRFDSANGV